MINVQLFLSLVHGGGGWWPLHVRGRRPLSAGRHIGNCKRTCTMVTDRGVLKLEDLTYCLENGGETWRVLLHINKRLHWNTSRPPSLHVSYSKPFLFMLGCFWDIIGTLISNQFVFTKFTITNFPIQHKTDLHKIKKCSLKFCGLTSFWTMIQTIYLAKSNVSAKFCFDWVLIGMKKLRFISVTWTI